MTEQDDTSPGAGDTGPRRRRARVDHVDHVADELAALRRDISEHAGLLAEVLPCLDEHTSGLGELRALVFRLVAEKDEQDAADQVEQEALRAAGLLDEPPAPWAWPVLDRPTAHAAWTALDRWIATVLVGQHQLTLRRLPSCWPRHTAAVAELSALRAAHVAAVAPEAHPAALLSWTRELPSALDRLTGANGAIDPAQCPPARHQVDPEQMPPQRDRDRVGAESSRPELWRDHLEQVAAADLAGRRPGPAAHRAPHARWRTPSDG